MIKDNERQLNRIRAVLDLLTVVAAYFLTYLLFFYIFPSEGHTGGTFSLITAQHYKQAVLYIAPLHLLMYILNHLYRPMRVTGRRREAVVILRANVIAVTLILSKAPFTAISKRSLPVPSPLPIRAMPEFRIILHPS